MPLSQQRKESKKVEHLSQKTVSMPLSQQRKESGVISTETCCIVIANNDVIYWISIFWIDSQDRNDEKAEFLKVPYRKSTVYYDAYLNAALAATERIWPRDAKRGSWKVSMPLSQQWQ